MSWSRSFPEPFVLTDGRKITTLAEAGRLILALPELHRANGHWIHAAQLIQAAAESPSEEAIASAAARFSLALREERLLPLRPGR